MPTAARSRTTSTEGTRGDGSASPQDEPVVACIGSLTDEKRVEDAIAAVARIPDAHLLVAGDGPRRDELEATAAS